MERQQKIKIIKSPSLENEERRNLAGKQVLIFKR